MTKFPKREYFFKPVLQAIQQLGGSGTNDEINEKVIVNMNFSEELLSIQHKNTNQSEFEYEMAWVRTMLKNQGLLEKSQRGVWSISANSELSSLEVVWDKNLESRVNEEVFEDENWKEKSNKRNNRNIITFCI